MSYKLAIVLSPEVLTQYEYFLENFASVTKDDLDRHNCLDQIKLAKQIIENSEAFK